MVPVVTAISIGLAALTPSCRAPRAQATAAAAPNPEPIDCAAFQGAVVEPLSPSLEVDVHEAKRLEGIVACFPKTQRLSIVLAGDDDLSPLTKLPALDWLELDPHASPGACEAIRRMPALDHVKHLVVRVPCEAMKFSAVLARMPELESFQVFDRKGFAAVFATPGTIKEAQNELPSDVRGEILEAARQRFPP